MVLKKVPLEACTSGLQYNECVVLALIIDAWRQLEDKQL